MRYELANQSHRHRFQNATLKVKLILNVSKSFMFNDANLAMKIWGIIATAHPLGAGAPSFPRLSSMTPQHRTRHAIYHVADNQVGVWSNPVSVTVPA